MASRLAAHNTISPRRPLKMRCGLCDPHCIFRVLLLTQWVALTQTFAPQNIQPGWMAARAPTSLDSRCSPHLSSGPSLATVDAHRRQAPQTQDATKGQEEEYVQLVRRHAKEATGGGCDLDALQMLLHCQFVSPAVLQQAVTHRSAAPKSLDSNQRLEYLGDAVLGMVVAEHLFRTFPQFDEGQLSTMRNEVVSASALAKVARREDLGRFALLNAGEEATGGRNKEALLADMVESLIAAVFVDQGIDAARTLVVRWLGDDIRRAASDPSGSDFKSRLQEYLRRVNAPAPSYHLVENGPKHNQKFTAHTLVNDNRLGWGVGKTKKAAEQAAAQYSLQLLEEKTPEEMARLCASTEGINED